MKKPMTIGLVGCGNISSIYLKNLTGFFKDARVTKCADLDFERAKKTAGAFDEEEKALCPGVEAVELESIYTDDQIDIILNLTIPQAHYSVAIKALENGKHVYGEKPLAVTRDEGRAIVARAEEKGLRAGSAPDTFLGAGIQTARKLIDDGWIGEVVSCSGTMCCPGHESWHPSPEFYYLTGGGPMFDMGPYYLTALVNLLGPVQQVCSMVTKARDQRIITSADKHGKIMPVEVPTHLVGQLAFTSGALGNLTMSFDTFKSDQPCIEVHGTEGSLSIPDPNTFGGSIKFCRGRGNWQDVPLLHGYAENSRGIGVADLAAAVQQNRPHRASAELGMHVLEIMHAFHDSAAEQRFITLQSTCCRPEALQPYLLPGEITD